MKKTLLFVAMALIGLSFTTNAEVNIEGTYRGDLSVTIVPPASTQTNDIILVKNQVTGLYVIQINNLVVTVPGVGDMPMPPIALDEIEALEDGENVLLQRDEPAEGPTVMGQTSTITLTSGSVIANTLSLQLSIGVQGMGDVLVTFDGDLFNGVGLISVKANSKLNISVFNDNVQLSGVESGVYSIYNVNGVLVKASTFAGGQLNVSSLPAGVYLLSVNGQIAKFVKK
jgi:hypothetical protein